MLKWLNYWLLGDVVRIIGVNYPIDFGAG